MTIGALNKSNFVMYNFHDNMIIQVHFDGYFARKVSFVGPGNGTHAKGGGGAINLLKSDQNVFD